MHTVTTVPANVADVVETGNLLHGEKGDLCRPWLHRCGQVRRFGKEWTQMVYRCEARQNQGDARRRGLNEATNDSEHVKEAVRSKVEHSLRVDKRQFGYQKVRFKGLAKNTMRILVLFALPNLRVVRRSLMLDAGDARS